MLMDSDGQMVFAFEQPIVQLLTPDELYLQMDEAMLRRLFEDNRLELKPNGQHARALSEYIVMWANTAPAGGLVVVGVRNDDVVEGCSTLSPRQLNDIEGAGETFCPDAQYETKRVLVHRDGDGAEDFVVVFRSNTTRPK